MMTKEESLAKVERLKRELFVAFLEHSFLFGDGDSEETPVGLLASGIDGPVPESLKQFIDRAASIEPVLDVAFATPLTDKKQ